MTHNAANIPENLRRLRTQRGMSAIELASVLGVGRHFLGKLERGDKVPSVPRLLDLARALGVTPNELLEQSACGGVHLL